MSQENWQRLEDLFHAALEREPEARQAFLDEACAEDADLRQQVERLLAQGEQAGSFLEHPAIGDESVTSTSTVSLLGQQFGPYRIVSLLGSGGMSQVFKAHDSRLNRSVAVKVCAAEFSGRFTREARAIAALNHPNICQLYDVGPNYLVMELVEGPTLAERIKQGPLPLEKALPIAKQITEAIEAAHEKGIVHRDLKPGNIKLRPEGTVKVLDFGLAKVEPSPDPSREPTPSRDREGADPDNSPTLTIEDATRLGTILGTVPYMAPEQALGKAADKRADIWAFGCVLYEMVTGKRAFSGESTTEILAAVVKGEPDFSRVPAKVRRLIEACLQKDPKQRLRDIADAWKLLDDSAELTAESGSGLWRRPPGLRTWQARTPAPLWIAAAVLTIVAAVAVAGWRRATRPVNHPLVRLDIDLGPEVTLPNLERGTHNVTLSPDGTRLLYLSGNPPRLYTRPLGQLKATELPGTDNAIRPFFSPDGQWVGFFAAGKLSKISVEGGAVVPLGACPCNGASWGADGKIIGGGMTRGLLQVPANGGTPTTVLELAPGDSEYIFPQILPGGKGVLFENRTRPDRNTDSIEVFSFADRRRKTVVRGGANPEYLPSGHLIYTNKGTLFAIAFDVNRLETRGTAVPILDDVAYWQSGGVDLDFARNGTLVYRRGGAAGAPQQQTIQWIDGAGKKEPLLAKPGAYSNPRISPDGKRLLLLETRDVWVYDLQRDVMIRLTFGSSLYYNSVWSPDSRYVFFTAQTGIYWTRSDGAGQPQQLTQSKNLQLLWSFTPDGQRLAYNELIPNYQIWTLPLEEQGGQLKAGKPEQFLKSQFNDLSPAFSPDGHWLAYLSDASGKYEVYVRAFSSPASWQAGQWQVSNGGVTPTTTLTMPVAWSRSGRELIYQAGDQLMTVSYSVNGDSFVADKPRVWIDKLGGTSWDLAPDGKHVAVITPVASGEAPKTEHEIVLLQNFFDELKRRVPVK